MPDSNLTRAEMAAKLQSGQIVRIGGRTASSMDEVDFLLSATDGEANEMPSLPVLGASQFSTMKRELASAVAEAQNARSMADSLRDTLDETEKNLDEANDNIEKLGDKIEEVAKERDTLVSENGTLKAQVAELQAELDGLKAAKPADQPATSEPAVDAAAPSKSKK